MRKRPGKSEGQLDLFGEEPATTPVPVVESNTYDWNWWDPWPAGLTQREYATLQIKRDLRAIAEGEEDDTFLFRDRVAAFRGWIQAMP